MSNFTSLTPLGPSYIDYGYLYEDSRITLPEFKVVIPSLMPRMKSGNVPIKSNLFVNAPECKPAVSNMISLRNYFVVKSIAAHRTEYYGDVMSGDTGVINGKTTIQWSSGNTTPFNSCLTVYHSCISTHYISIVFSSMSCYGFYNKVIS